MIVWFNKADIEKAENATSITDALAAIDAIIVVLFGAMAKAARTANMDEYSTDDGQAKLRVKYKDVSAIAAHHTALIRMKNYYLAQRNGRMSRLLDSKNFPGFWNFGNLIQ